jgi:hypothetical protein
VNGSIQSVIDAKRNQILAQIGEKNSSYFEAELDKLDAGVRSTEPLKMALKTGRADRFANARLALNLRETPAGEKRQLETKRDEAWKGTNAQLERLRARRTL